MARSETEKNARDLVRDLHKRLPVSLPVRFYFSKRLSEFSWSECELKGDPGRHFIIRVKPGMEWDVTRECIIHEWAHCRTWGAVQSLSSDHDAHWGIEYAATYREANGVT